MPQFTYQPMTSNDKSALSEGWHPAFLVAITDEPTPTSWQMAAKSPRMWRWNVAVWEAEHGIAVAAPEHQSVPSSQAFSPGGKFQPSKAYIFTCKLLGRQIAVGESVDLDPMMPLPCRVLVTRRDKLGQPMEYANITDLQGWPEGQALLTPDLRAKLATWWQMKQAQPQTVGQGAPLPQSPPQYAQPAQQTQAPAQVQPTAQPQAPTPGGWAAPAQPSTPAQPATPGKVGW